MNGLFSPMRDLSDLIPSSSFNLDSSIFPNLGTQGLDFKSGYTRNALGNWIPDDSSIGFGSFMDKHGGLLGSLLNSFGGALMGMRQYGLAKKALSQNQDQFRKNYEAQRKTLNTAMEDRQRARVASNPNQYESVDDYMRRNRI